jgi:predicted O-linked N-acetylglucosamine transferase (SPINDLY family)
MRQRLEKSFDKFLDVRHLSELDIARLARDLMIDIAIDLGGYTQDSRPAIFGHRAAPIQINYLGYPGTTGAGYLDYFIGDRATISNDDLEHFSEKIIFMPNSFQVNPSQRLMGLRDSTRAAHGLPESAFVFCCFNNNWKVTPDIFKLWARILNGAEGSVLWVQNPGKIPLENLSKAFESAGIGASRVIFAAKLPNLSDHLDRYRLADLFLDTAPYGAHTTASDALWAGLPVLTRPGKSFASRVASSLLHAIGLPELIAETAESYEALAIALARNPEKISALKVKLATNRFTHPLFNTALFAQRIESAYAAVYERYQNELPIDHIHVNHKID